MAALRRHPERADDRLKPGRAAPHRGASAFDSRVPRLSWARGRLAQLGERLPYKQEAAGSSPAPPTEKPAGKGSSLLLGACTPCRLLAFGNRFGNRSRPSEEGAVRARLAGSGQAASTRLAGPTGHPGRTFRAFCSTPASARMTTSSPSPCGRAVRHTMPSHRGSRRRWAPKVTRGERPRFSRCTTRSTTEFPPKRSRQRSRRGAVGGRAAIRTPRTSSCNPAPARARRA